MERWTIQYNSKQSLLYNQDQLFFKFEGRLSKTQLTFFTKTLIKISEEQPMQQLCMDFSEATMGMDLINAREIASIYTSHSFYRDTKICIIPSKERIYQDFFAFYEKVLSNHNFNVELLDKAASFDFQQWSIQHDFKDSQLRFNVIGKLTKRQLAFFTETVIDLSIDYPMQELHLNYEKSNFALGVMDIRDIANMYDEMSFSREIPIFITPARPKHVNQPLFAILESELVAQGFYVMIAEEI